MLVGLGGAAGAVGVAVTMSAVSAPTARADDFTDVIATVETQIADGQVAFSAAASDFGSNLLTPAQQHFSTAWTTIYYWRRILCWAGRSKGC
jgi:hypothetical protein